MLFIFVAILFGLFIKKFKPNEKVRLVLGIILLIAMLAVGIAFPIYLDRMIWLYVVFAYIFAASVMPMWILKQPRDYLSTFLLLAMIAGGVIGVLAVNPTINMPAFVGFNVNGKDLFPILFITIACGAVSGFHSLVSSVLLLRLFLMKRYFICWLWFYACRVCFRCCFFSNCLLCCY